MSDTHYSESQVNSATVSPGDMVRRQREQQGISLVDASRALNLRPAVVDGLENDNYDEIPVPAYRRGYLRAYAKFLGLDERPVLEAYTAQYGGQDVERKVTPVQVSKPPSRIGAWLFKLVTLLIIVGLIALTVMWWQSRGDSSLPGFGFNSSPAPMEESGDLPTSDDSSAADDSLDAGDMQDMTTGELDMQEPVDPINDELDTPSAPMDATPGSQTNNDMPLVSAPESDQTDTQSNPAAEEEIEDASAQDAADEPSTIDADSTADEAQESATEDGLARLELTFNEQSWTEIFDATNQRVFVGLQSPGTSASVEGEPPFRLTVGNATGVELRYQGEPVDLVAQAGANNVARFTLGE
ncbi:DUF4115 domain-containing protein [Halomonas sp. Bachu 37]|uniref:RodZ domain-containing protein n=1 Tax=Halomonas kashgarensis TaxID=3084920 RepID=UPI003217587E